MIPGGHQFADYVGHNFVAAESDFPPTLWARAPDLMYVTTMELSSIMDI